jgi:hypothetical protein
VATDSRGTQAEVVGEGRDMSHSWAWMQGFVHGIQRKPNVAQVPHMHMDDGRGADAGMDCDKNSQPKELKPHTGAGSIPYGVVPVPRKSGCLYNEKGETNVLSPCPASAHLENLDCCSQALNETHQLVLLVLDGHSVERKLKWR